jgi:purine catabolism regulator
VLHVGRQSLYQRLERIEAVLGYPVTDAACHGSLVAATAAYRLRAGAASRGNSSA